MPLKNPKAYLRDFSDQKYAAKPTALTKITSRSDVHPQRPNSPFFTLLPAEIRHQIYTLALVAYPDLSKPYPKNSPHYRPSSTHARKVPTELLHTCRLAYLETALLPVSVSTHVVYGTEPSHAPSTYRSYLFPKRALRTAQREAIRSVQVYAQQFWLEDWNERGQWHDFCRSWGPEFYKQKRKDGRNDSVVSQTSGLGENALGPGLEHLRITIRHTDWWYYFLGPQSPLALDPRKAGRVRHSTAYDRRSSTGSLSNIASDEGSRNNSTDITAEGNSEASQTTDTKTVAPDFELNSWGSRFAYLPTLKKLELELETLSTKRAELDAVVDLAPSWRFPLGNDPPGKDGLLIFDSAATERNSWMGREVSCGKNAGQIPRSRDSTVGNLFRRRASEWADHETQHGAEVEYYVVILTWRAYPPGKVNENSGDTQDLTAGTKADESASLEQQMQDGQMPATIADQQQALRAGLAGSAARNVIPSYWG